MEEIKTSKDGINYLRSVILERPLTVMRAALFKIPHTSGKEDISLKLGRYKKKKGMFNLTFEEIETLTPKSELTLTSEEFSALISFLQQNFEPFKDGVKKYIPIDEKFDKKSIEHLKAIFDNPDKQALLDFIIGHEIIPEELFTAFQQLSKVKAVEQFEEMLEQDLTETNWQKWFTDNSWVLGTEFVKILDERAIDTKNITDFLMQAYDGFLDIVEIKRPEGNLKFWANSKDHDNYIPSNDLIKAITQASKYLFEVEQEANSIKFRERVGNVKTIKPRCILIFGRSDDWDKEQKESYRILNSNYHNLTIMTYDHILARAKRIVT